MNRSVMHVLAPIGVSTLIALGLWVDPAHAQIRPPSLQGSVSSATEGAMEGVLVGARRRGSNISVAVMSDGKGEFSFPAGRLEPGSYDLFIKAAGYALPPANSVELANGIASRAELRLQPYVPLAEHLTNAEWIASAPGSDEMKRLMLNCTDCHNTRRIFESNHSAQEFLQVFERMSGYFPGASDLQPQRLAGDARRPPVPRSVERQFADYLASVNRFDRTGLPFAPKPFPRPTGRANKVVFTEYALPRREIQPHAKDEPVLRRSRSHLHRAHRPSRAVIRPPCRVTYLLTK